MVGVTHSLIFNPLLNIAMLGNLNDQLMLLILGSEPLELLDELGVVRCLGTRRSSGS